MENQQQIKKKMDFDERKIIAKIKQNMKIDISVIYRMMRKMNRKKAIEFRKE